MFRSALSALALEIGDTLFFRSLRSAGWICCLTRPSGHGFVGYYVVFRRATAG
jgi:hypothetical protein